MSKISTVAMLTPPTIKSRMFSYINYTSRNQIPRS